MTKDVSIIIPVYNTAPFLKKCIESVLAQTLHTLEIIIIDDASTDNSLEILKEFQEKDSRIKIIELSENTPGGVGIPANIGINQAQGEYIGFVDSDDWIKPEMFETLYSLAKKNHADYVFCDFIMYDEKTDTYKPSNDKGHWECFDDLQQKLTVKDRSALLRLSSVPWRKLYKRSFLEQNNLRFPEGDFFYEDTPFHYMVTLKAVSVTYIDNPLYYHRISRPAQTMSGKGRKYFAFLRHGEIIYTYMEKEGFIENYINDYFRFIVNNFYWVWDRLNKNERKEFFRTLHSFLIQVDKQAIQEFSKNSDFLDSYRFYEIYTGNFKAYSHIMFKCKTKLGSILRGIDYLKVNGIFKLSKKIIKKII